jgi:hypothetical protein
MNQSRNIPFIVSAILLCVVVYAITPYYQWYVDPDATAYLTIIRRYAEHNYAKAVNGYWSPWSCWLSAAHKKIFDLTLLDTARVVNTWGAIGFLFITHSFLKFFNIKRSLVWLCELTMVGFLAYAVFGQLFDDLWECFFLLAALRLMLREDFARKAWLWVVTGALGALAYVAKAYAFPFFILNVVVCTYFITENRKQWMKICATAIIVMFAVSFPWIYALHDKYGVWMTGTAGKLNLSWYTVGHPYWKEGITHLVPPVYADSPYYWEDPYVANGATPNLFSSLAMFKMQLVRIPYTVLKLMQSMCELSPLFFVAFGAMLFLVLSKKFRAYFPEQLHIVAVSFLLFSLAYLLINFESRYLWYMVPLSLVVLSLLLQKLLEHFNDSKWIGPKAYAFMALSFLYFPVVQLKKMYKVGADDNAIAARMKQEGIKGSFTAVTTAGTQVQGVERIAYFSGNSFYAIPNPDITHEQLLAEMKRYGVKYYIHFYNKAEGDSYHFTGPDGRDVPEAMRDEAYGIKVFGPLP